MILYSQMRHYSSKYGVSDCPGEGLSFTKLTMDTMNDSSGAEIKVCECAVILGGVLILNLSGPSEF